MPVSSRISARAALTMFALALAACLAVYVAMSAPGAWFPAAGVKALTARDFALARGTGALDHDALVISAVDATGVALLTANTDFRSVDYPVIAWIGSNFPVRADVRFLWRTDYAPGKLNSVQVAVAAGRLAPVNMSQNPDWVGRIIGVALIVRGPLAEPVLVDRVAIKPGGVVGQLGDRVREWMTFERWSGTSINTVTGGADVQELPLPALLVVALLLAAGLWYALARRRHAAAALPLVLAVLFLTAWVVLDLQWTWNLARQVVETRTLFGGKDSRERHLADGDGPLYSFVEKARAMMPATPVRVFVVSDAAYFRGRAAYHLYPHNVWYDPFANAVPVPSSLHAGDYVMVYQRRGMQYNPAEKKLRIEGSEPIPAEAVLVEPYGALFRIM